MGELLERRTWKNSKAEKSFLKRYLMPHQPLKKLANGIDPTLSNENVQILEANSINQTTL